jgi:ligand-binding sensor domain-containing protein
MRIASVVLALVASACHGRRAGGPAPATAVARATFAASRVRAFSDSLAVTAISDSPTSVWVGTASGLLHWQGGRYSALTQKDGLPADRILAATVDQEGGIWVATESGLTRGLHGAFANYPLPPIGTLISDLVSDGKTTWGASSAGLSRLRQRHWEQYFISTPTTGIAFAEDKSIWVGTDGAGILRVHKDGNKVELYGPNEGCEVTSVRGIAAVGKTLFAVGKNKDGARAAFFDGERFFSYALETPAPIEWAARDGGRMLFGVGEKIYALRPIAADELQMPPAPPDGLKLAPLLSYAMRPRSLGLRPDLPSNLLAFGAAPKLTGQPPPPPGPPLVVEELSLRLPEGVTVLRGSAHGLLIGTRFLGAMRLENEVPRIYRINDLAQGGARLTVACARVEDKTRNDCFLATGTTRAWRFDGHAFATANVDPEPGSRVLAVILDPRGAVLAIHRGADDSKLRFSRVDDGRFTPIALHAVRVPHGAPELNFAKFAPDGHLWVGLRYFDRDGDARDFGAIEIRLDAGQVLPHKELPQDVVAMAWSAQNEAWFATRSGVARLSRGELRVFTENDGMESEITRDVSVGKAGEIYVATQRGTGRFDGKRWIFPHLGAFYAPANSLSRDSHGNVFVGTDKGVFCVGDCTSEPIDPQRGLLDERVLDLAVDGYDRVWALTQKGINLVDP